MTPRAKTSLLNLSAVAAAIVTITGAAFGGGARAVSLVDHRYVPRDTFAAYRAVDSTRHIVDSLNLREALKDIRQHEDSVSGVLKACIRHPEDCR